MSGVSFAPVASQSVEPPSGLVNVRSLEIGAKGDGVADDTAAIQAAIDRYPRVYLPRGRYRIDPRVGLSVRNGTQLLGDGPTETLLVADRGGGTIAQLSEYGPGSIIRRAFDPRRANAYVTRVRIADVAILMNHPPDAVTTDAIQIGLDLRNISRSLIERVHVGNVPPIGVKLPRTQRSVYLSQGYGIVFGTRSGGDIAYAGGEVNTVRDSAVWGAFKLIVHDDPALSPLSAAHNTVVETSDLQTGHSLISQESTYAHANVWRSLVLQNVVPQAGNPSPTYVIRIEGSRNRVDGGYVEASPSARYLIFLGRDSYANRIDLQTVSAGPATRTVDLGRANTISATSRLSYAPTEYRRATAKK
ncbi:MAG: glycosyl hydrolase family 28-related protein [Pseudomonadota bacterium]